MVGPRVSVRGEGYLCQTRPVEYRYQSSFALYRPYLPKAKIIDQPAELLSIYPTLLELCGLPLYDRNEGKSLVPIMMGEAYEPSVVITTFGMNNHTVKSDR